MYVNCLIRIALGEDQPFMEILPEVLRNFGRAVQCGNRNIYQSLPRMLTIWFEYGNYCYSNSRHADNRVRIHCPLLSTLSACDYLTSAVAWTPATETLALALLL